MTRGRRRTWTHPCREGMHQWPTTSQPKSQKAGSSQKPSNPDPPKQIASKGLTSYRLSPLNRFKDQLNESSQSEAEEFIRIKDPEKVRKRVIAAYRRVILRLTFVVTSSLMQRVERHWEAQTEQRPLEEHDQPIPKSSSKAKRRDDLTGVGQPIEPTAKTYPISRSLCSHEDTSGQSYLQAQGGQRRCPVSKELVPMYVWVCRACGARWERIRNEDSKATARPSQSGTALQPRPSSSSGLRTQVKRERPPSDIKVDVVMIHSENAKGEGQTDPPRQE